MKFFWSSWVGQRLLFKMIRTGSLEKAIRLINQHQLSLVPTKEGELFILASITIIFSAMVERSWVKAYLSHRDRMNLVGFKKKAFEKDVSYYENLLLSKFCYTSTVTSKEKLLNNCLKRNMDSRQQQVSEMGKKSDPKFISTLTEMSKNYNDKQYGEKSLNSMLGFLSQNLANRAVLDEELTAFSEFGLLDLVNFQRLPQKQWVLVGETLARRWFELLSFSDCYGDVLKQCWDFLDPQTQETFKKEGYKALHFELCYRFDLHSQNGPRQMDPKPIRFFEFLMSLKNNALLDQELKDHVGKEVGFVALCTRQYHQIQGVDVNEALAVCCAPLLQEENQFKEDEQKWSMLFDRLQSSLRNEASQLYEKISQALLAHSDLKGQKGFDFLFNRHLMFHVRQTSVPAVAPIKVERF